MMCTAWHGIVFTGCWGEGTLSAKTPKLLYESHFDNLQRFVSFWEKLTWIISLL